MSKEEIISGSKLIAEYLGWRYIPFNDLEGFSKAGWWRIAKPVWGDDDLGIYMMSKLKNHRDKLGSSYYICRNHEGLRFWNSLDALIPAIKKIEKEKVNIRLSNNGCHFYCRESEKSFENYDLPNWSNNVFKVVVEYLKRK